MKTRENQTATFFLQHNSSHQCDKWWNAWLTELFKRHINSTRVNFTLRLKNHIHCTFIFTFLGYFYLKSFFVCLFCFFFLVVISSIWLLGKDKTQSCKSNDKKTIEKFNNCIDRQRNKVFQLMCWWVWECMWNWEVKCSVVVLEGRN